MVELEPLAAELREELGRPPEAWQQAQRVRWREGLRAPERHFSLRRVAPWVLASLSVLAVVLGVAAARRPATIDERWLVAEELRGPLRLDDGSSIGLEAGGRGRLAADSGAVRFDLHRGRATFDVVPGHRRTWTIRAGKNEVRVVGTRFSVFFGAGEAFEVAVERGVVAVRVPDRNASIELTAGDRLQGSPGQLEVTHVSASGHPSVARSASAAEEQAEEAGLPVPESSEARAPSAPPAALEPPSGRADWQLRYAEGKYAESLALVRSSGVAKHLSDLSAGALAELADVARLGGDPELAVRALNLLIQRFPNASAARDARFQLGRVQALRGDDAAALDAFESYVRNVPSGRYVNETRGRLMELYSKRGDTDRARSLARRYLDVTPNGPYQRLARSLVTPER
jgi:TolA-binding protein